MTKQITLTNDQKKRYRTIGHTLNPVVMIAEKGLSESVLNEISRALNDHELIKIRISVADRETKNELITRMCEASQAQLVQKVGNIVLIYRKAKERNNKLSNLTKFQN